jgi:3-phenylpropionate/trans-cinnamate dioxygenase ferredoxin reductase subunit
MASTCNLVINGHTVKAHVGETLVDAGLGGWVVIPHDCCSGQCETCRVTVVGGAIDDQGTGDGRTVLACLATVEGDAEIEFDVVAAASKRSGIVTEIFSPTPDMVELVIELEHPFVYRPGQYFSVKFAGFPARDLSATLRSDGSLNRLELVFHFRRYPGGLVSSQLGATIREGHRVKVRGPYGHAFLREGVGPVVLISGGTGWAPIWSIARAVRREQRQRDLLVIAGVRSARDLYMRESLDWLIDDGVATVIATAETGAVDPILPGRPTHYLPSLGLEDTVYVAGPPGLVDAVKSKARLARARCYADPFLPGVHKVSLIERILRMVRSREPSESSIIQTALPPDRTITDIAGSERGRRFAQAGIGASLSPENAMAARKGSRRRLIRR